MAENEDLQSVFEELKEFDVGSLDHGNPKTCKPKILLSLGLVEENKLKLLSNEIVSEEVKKALETTPSAELDEMLHWVNGCLINRGIHLSACRDRVWASYHKNLITNISGMTAVTKSRQAAALLALQVMKELVTLNYSEPVPDKANCGDISDREEEVLAHIAGYLLRKRGLEVQALTSERSDGLTALMDRGGLTYAHENFTSVVREFEVQFRQLHPRCVDYSQFENAVIAQNIPSHFFQLLDKVDSTSEDKELLFRDILHLFFIVRVHQKCRNLMEKCLRLSKRSRKALRDSI